MNESATSPLPQAQVYPMTFDFCEAIQQIIAGKKVTKLEWDDPEYFIQLIDNRLKIHKPDNKFYDLIISLGDMTGEDYIVL